MTKTPYIGQGSFHGKKLRHLAMQDTRVACDVIHMLSSFFQKPNICLVIIYGREREELYSFP
jgi:hypothetical protein